MTELLTQWLMDRGLGATSADYIGLAIMAVLVVLLAMTSNFVARRILLEAVAQLVKRTTTTWDDVLMRRRLFHRLSHLAPALVIYATASLFPGAQQIIERLSTVYMILAGLFVLNAFLNGVVDIYNSYDVSRHRPMKGYVQLVQIVIAIFVGIYALARLMDRDPWPLLTGLGAMTAVLLLVFKDTILGLVASVQLSTNDMVRIGDWIEMPKYGADGDVIDVTLHTVKVQNWDKTITTIPSYALISDSFRNWRGMKESGGRRIKRALNIDLSTVQFCSAEMLDRFEKYQLIADYIRTRREEIAQFNKENGVDSSILVNGRNMTNLGTFRAYVAAYLRSHPRVHKDMTFLIRYLAPGDNGLPLEIYVFSNDQVWANYEAIQADIFDHIFAVLPYFELRAFQHPTGSDFRRLAGESR
ncbi:mechanosensitive ion channel family protein [bacterium]|nr:mechanosensitive ion channel family protein [bacterium]MCB2202330.1 mechanosensitive ion channel family protein [bacterium]